MIGRSKQAMKKKQKKKVATNAQEKMYAYIVSLATNNDFIDQVEEIRKKFSLPAGGFKTDLGDELGYINSLPPYTDERGEQTDIQKEVYDLASRFGVSTSWLDTVSDYVLYNNFFFTRVAPLVQMIDVLGLLNETENDYKNYKDGKITVRGILDNITDSLPTAIFLSPHATGRDIIDFVKKEYKKQIEPAQIAYREKGTKIGKVRKRNYAIQERDMYICKNKNLPLRELVRKVNEKFDTQLEYTYINKIIAKKCQRGK